MGVVNVSEKKFQRASRAIISCLPIQKILRAPLLWSQIMGSKYYGVELPIYVREGASG